MHAASISPVVPDRIRQSARILVQRSRIIGIFGIAVLLAACFVMKFSMHRSLWLIGLTASIPLFAAVVGAIPESKEKD
jgi:hypothetical protein